MMDSNPSIFDKIGQFVVDKRNIIFILYTFAVIFCYFSLGWVKVEEDIVNYLPEDGKTRQGIAIMKEEFTTFATAQLMVSNISFSRAQDLANRIGEIDGVSSVMFDNTEDYYKKASALFVILFEAEEDAEISLKAMDEIRDLIAPYDSSVSTMIGYDYSKELANDMIIIALLAIIIITVVLFFTTRAYAEIIVFYLTFGLAAILNMGTNFIYGSISFVSNSVAAILQLALAIDYSIIFSHRFSEERDHLPAREAAITALAKSIPEIASSSLTTVAGLAAMVFINFGIGMDLAIVMIKGILFSMLSVFTLMPGLLVTLSSLIDKSRHKSFVPSIKGLGRFSIKTRRIMPPIFAILLLLALFLSSNCPYLFSMEEVRSHRISEAQRQQDRIEETFGKVNTMALIVPAGDYEAEGQLLSNLSSLDGVTSTMGLANTQALAGYMLTDDLTPRQFAELVDIDYELAQLLYSAYSVFEEDYAKLVAGIASYKVPLIDMFEFLHDQIIEGSISIDDDLTEELKANYALLSDARLNMEGENYSRLIINSSLPIESNQTFEFLNKVYDEASQYYDLASVYIVGESSNALDLSLTFDKDNIIISILSVAFVIIVLIITFRSIGLSILLIAVIQTSIWVNFSFPYIRGQGLYFLGYLVVSAIQMGANIDYAIVITSRYLEFRKSMDRAKAAVEAINRGFTTVITSGSILAIAGYLIGFISTDGTISILGSYIGQGTIISIVLVIFVLPQLLYLGDFIIEKTSFKLSSHADEQKKRSKLYIDGRLRAYVNGELDAHIDGTIDGEIRAIEGEGEGHEEHK
ncbi:MAG: MMPL family transporter [Bacillota bacterium]|jgi:predicted RND superfamily exporter protein|nr:MMPL family transporter [Bacillota bacterium]